MASMEALKFFPELRAARCQVAHPATGASEVGLSALAANQALRSIALIGCGDELNLAPLLRLPALERIELTAIRRPPPLTALSGVSGEWTLLLTAPACEERLSELAGLHTLSWLHLRACEDLRNLSALPARPRSLQRLSLFGLPGLASLDGIGQWDGLTALELLDCPQLTEFAALASLLSLQHISLGLLSEDPRDLSPLAALPQLTELSLMGSSTFDVSSLAGVQDLTITVPTRVRVTGAEELGPGSRVVARRDYSKPSGGPDA
jgi:hypothetical protein